MRGPLYNYVVLGLSSLIVGTGLAVIIETARHHGQLGYLIGGLLVAAGLGRLYLYARK
jgi:hypothetical protein